MGMEADRMVNLRLTEKEVVTERKVILEERRSRIENNPSALLDEQMDAALYLNHPYGIPVIGWEHEMAKLSRDDALTFYKRYYAPNNAILVVSRRRDARVRSRPGRERPTARSQPTRRCRQARASAGAAAARRTTPRAEGPARRQRLGPALLLGPGLPTAQPGEAEALDLLMKIAAYGSTSRLYQASSSSRDRVASTAGGCYSGSGLDSGTVALYAVVVATVPTSPKPRPAMDAVLADIVANGVTEAELERAKNGFIADFIYESDSQATLARRYGWGVAHRPHDRTDRKLARGHRQGDRRGRARRCGQVS